MLRTFTSSGLKQTQRVSSKALHHQTPAAPPHATASSSSSSTSGPAPAPGAQQSPVVGKFTFADAANSARFYSTSAIAPQTFDSYQSQPYSALETANGGNARGYHQFQPETHANKHHNSYNHKQASSHGTHSNHSYRNNHTYSTGKYNNSGNIYSQDNQFASQLALFDECLAQNSTYDLATGKISGGVSHFWFAVKKVIPIYRSLIYSGQLNEKRMAEFVSLLRNGLRIHRLELSKLKKNLDKDSNNPIKNIHYLLTCAIREVSYNLLDGLISLNSHGLTHLFKAYKDLGFTYEAVHIWETGKKILL